MRISAVLRDKLSFEVQFAVVAIMFLLFDIEVLYLFPIISSLTNLYSLDIFLIFIFYILLLLGILYEISRKVLDVTGIEALNK